MPITFPTSGLLAYYKCDESSGNVVDAVTGSYPGTDNGSSGTTTGKINSARTYNGSSQRHEITTNPLGSVQKSTVFSLSGWVYLNGYADAGRHYLSRFIGERHAANYFEYGFSVGSAYDNAGSAQVPGVFTGKAYVSSTHVGTGSASLSTWMHFVGTFDGSSNVLFYLNGSLNASGGYDANAATATANSKALCFGGQYDETGGAQAFGLNGNIDEVGIWNRVLNSTEVGDLYNGGSALAYPGGSTVYNQQMCLIGVGQ